MMSTSVTVWCDVDGRTVRVGTAYVSERRKTVTTAFVYDPAWQADRDAHAISPELDLTTAQHQTTGLPGTIGDSAPDRWGRKLIQKRLRSLARDGGGTPRESLEVDFLLGVSDLTRQGALRYKTDADGPFLSPETTVPKLIDLPRLLRASDAVEADDPESFAAVKELLDAGTGSLGGARPKASVRDDNGRIAIAKFPHPKDEWDVMAWEATALDLAQRAGISVPTRRLVPVGGRHSLVLDRFDRRGPQRIGYASALTLVGGYDGGTYDYLEVAEAIITYGSDVRADLRELFRRIAFGIAINNTDDHLRNTGFLRTRSGWQISPLFDVNPNPHAGAPSQTTVAFASGSRFERWAALRDAASSFDLTASTAESIMGEVVDAVRTWRGVARANEVPAAQVELFAEPLDTLVSASTGP